MNTDVEAMAEVLVLSAATSNDTTAAVSPSLWARIAPLLSQVESKLVAAGIDEREAPLLKLLGESPYDLGLRKRLVERAARKLREDQRFRDSSASLLLHIAEFGRLLPHHGGRASRLAPSSPLAEQILALQRSHRVVERSTSPDISVVLSFRCPPGEPHRRRNLHACIAAIGNQTLARTRYSVTAVEQDAEPRQRDDLEPHVDRYVFAKNAGAFNYAWGRNVGVKAGVQSPKLCLLDADAVVQPTFLESCVAGLSGRIGGFMPYDRLLCLDERSSAFVAERLTHGEALPALDELRGQVMAEIYGLAVATTRDVYNQIGGQDERYRGWGEEDNEFYERLSEVTEVKRHVNWAYHLDHPRPNMLSGDGGRINAGARGNPREKGGPFGHLDRYATDT